jgi:hypothetical protein
VSNSQIGITLVLCKVAVRKKMLLMQPESRQLVIVCGEEATSIVNCEVLLLTLAALMRTSTRTSLSVQIPH